MFGITLDERLSSFFSDSKGNILRMMFDPQFASITTWIKDEQWRLQIEIFVYMFRVFSKNYVGSGEYVNLVRALRRLPNFQEVWRDVEAPEFLPVFPIPMRFGLRTGQELTFIITSTIDIGLQVSKLNKIMYVPVDQRTKDVLTKSMIDVPHMYVNFDLSKPQGFDIVPL